MWEVRDTVLSVRSWTINLLENIQSSSARPSYICSIKTIRVAELEMGVTFYWRAAQKTCINILKILGTISAIAGRQRKTKKACGEGQSQDHPQAY
jgi:hypothetical protein